MRDPNKEAVFIWERVDPPCVGGKRYLVELDSGGDIPLETRHAAMACQVMLWQLEQCGPTWRIASVRIDKRSPVFDADTQPDMSPATDIWTYHATRRPELPWLREAK